MEEIRGWPFGPSVRTRVVAAIDLNHNGRAALADRLVEAAVSSGCDGVKFLIRHTTRFYAKDALAEPFLDAPQLGTTLGEVMERLELPLDELLRIRAACRNRIAFIAAPHDDAAVDACGALERCSVQSPACGGRCCFARRCAPTPIWRPRSKRSDRFRSRCCTASAGGPT
jgi:sialic acid synthase SpsE